MQYIETHAPSLSRLPLLPSSSSSLSLSALFLSPLLSLVLRSPLSPPLRSLPLSLVLFARSPLSPEWRESARGCGRVTREQGK